VDKAVIRAATAADVPVVTQIVEQAYRHYIPRMGKPPGPMLDDYSARISEQAVWVIEEGTAIAAILVLLPKPDHLLLDNIAVTPCARALDSVAGYSRSPKRTHCEGATVRSACTRTRR
jgi:hypothetical protein